MSKKFCSVYAPFIGRFIEFKRQLGFKYHTEEAILLTFDRFAVEQGETTLGITKDLAGAWNRKRPNESDSYWFQRAGCLNQFAAFLCGAGIASHQSRLPRIQRNFTPHIFSSVEIGRLFNACDAMRSQKKTLRRPSSRSPYFLGSCTLLAYGSEKLLLCAMKMSVFPTPVFG